MKTLLFHVLLIGSLFYVGCKSAVKGERKETTSERHFFAEYKDTAITIANINTALKTVFTAQELGKPIGVSGTDSWLITVGGWYLNDRNILVQGTAFKKGNRFFPKPLRNTEVEFKGPFAGIIGFNKSTRTYHWVLPPNEIDDGLKYQRTENYHLLGLTESEKRLVFSEIVSGKQLEIDPENPIIEWSVAEPSDEIVLMERVGESFQVTSNSISNLLLSAQP